MKRQKRILFAKLGHFSHVNDHVAEQIGKNFPAHDLMVIDVKNYAKSNPIASAYNIAAEAATFGPSVLRNRGDLHSFFFRTPFMFRRLNQMLVREFAPVAGDLDFVIQTQGVFNARINRAPILVYTDYTFLNNLDLADHDPRLFRSETFLRYEADLYKTADAVAVTGSHVERTLIERYGCDPSRVRTVHVGSNVDVAPVSTDRSRYGAKHVLFVGVEWERKGGPALVEGFRRAAKDHPDARLTIVGCSPPVSDPRIDVVGPVPPKRMPGYYEAASVFCMPSLIEPLGIAAVEASLFRLPVIATQIGGFFETVTDGETGILVPLDDPGAIAGALRRLFEAPDLARGMGLAGFERNRIRFNWDEVGKRLRSMAETIAPGLREAA
ncbi:MAG: glycosyltransferase family 4 protein [Rhodopila sp.]|nr:glycosyltransferase family 4 protein [Rhodopila sp.]